MSHQETDLPSFEQDPAALATAECVPWGDWGRLQAALDSDSKTIRVVPRTRALPWKWRELDVAGLSEWVRQAHEHGRHLSLDLDSDVAEAELRRAARMLQIAQEAGVDDVQVRDPALFVLGKALPDLPLSWSDSMRVSNTADVRAAKRLGLSRVALGTRIAAVEIAAAAQSDGIAADMGTSGEACESLPGCCLLSSWSDGRSAHRGVCPCEMERRRKSERAHQSDPHAGAATEAGPELPGYKLEILVDERGIQCRCEMQGTEMHWTLPKTVIRRAHKAVSVGQLLEFFEAHAIADCQLDDGYTNAPDFLMMPRKVNYLADQVGKFLQRCLKKQQQAAETEASPSLMAVLDTYERCPSSRTTMGQLPDRARLDVNAVETFLNEIQPSGVIVEGVTEERLSELRSWCRRVPLIVALPPIFFEPQVAAIERLLEACGRAKCRVEVNSWGGWFLARSAGVRMEAGPSMPVLNSLAARLLGSLGFENLTWNMQADRRKLEQLSERCPVHASLVVFGRPALMISREPPSLERAIAASQLPNGTSLWSRQESEMWVVRPAEPFDLRSVVNDRVCVKHQVVDLVASPDPIEEWNGVRRRRIAEPFTFNYERRLI